jgi:sulfite reductase (NADPH) flavoprotein alpha-component
VLPRHPPATVDALLARHPFGRDTTVEHAGSTTTFADALATSELPEESHHTAPSAQVIVDGLRPLVPRKYSIASLPEDGAVQLIVRQERHPWGLGLASGWLTSYAPDAAPVALRFVENPSFEPALNDVPCLFIGNGSGYAGLRAHLRARVRAGRRRNWLIFGERQRAHDRIGGDELDRWIEGGHVQRVDLAFSRDGDERRYVQDHLRDAAIEVRTWIDEGAVIFVCGSLEGMAAGVDAALGDILGVERLEALIAEGRYRRDVY